MGELLQIKHVGSSWGLVGSVGHVVTHKQGHHTKEAELWANSPQSKVSLSIVCPVNAFDSLSSQGGPKPTRANKVYTLLLKHTHPV